MTVEDLVIDTRSSDSNSLRSSQISQENMNCSEYRPNSTDGSSTYGDQPNTIGVSEVSEPPLASERVQRAAKRKRSVRDDKVDEEGTHKQFTAGLNSI